MWNGFSIQTMIRKRSGRDGEFIPIQPAYGLVWFQEMHAIYSGSGRRRRRCLENLLVVLIVCCLEVHAV